MSFSSAPLVAASRVAIGLVFIAANSLPAAAQDLPAAKDLIQKWAADVNAQGYKGHKTSRATFAFDLPAMGMSANMEAVQSYNPLRSAQRIELPGMGEMRNGFDGTVGWATNPMQGATLLSGDALASAKEDADEDNYGRQSKAIVSSETVEKTKLNNEDCFKVKHTYKSGRTSFDCFSVATGLIVWSQTTTVTPQGTFDVVANYSAYKDFAGMKRPTTTTIDQAGQQIVLTLRNWEWDVVGEDAFAMPPDVKALVEKK